MRRLYDSLENGFFLLLEIVVGPVGLLVLMVGLIGLLVSSSRRESLKREMQHQEMLARAHTSAESLSVDLAFMASADAQRTREAMAISAGIVAGSRR